MILSQLFLYAGLVCVREIKSSQKYCNKSVNGITFTKAIPLMK